MLTKLLIFNLVAVFSIVLSEEVVKNQTLENRLDDVIFSSTENIIKNDKNNENEKTSENSNIRASKDLKYFEIPSHIQSRSSANPIGVNYESDEYNDDDDDEGIIGEVDDGSNYDYEMFARNEPIKSNNMNSGSRRHSENYGNSKKAVSVDNPRIYTLRDGLDIFRNFWRNRYPVKTEEVVPAVITLTAATPTSPTAPQEQNDAFGTATGTATGTGTITAPSADEIAQNNAPIQTPETPTPFFSFGRRRPVEYEILEEDSEPNSKTNFFAFNSNDDQILDDDEIHPEDLGKSAIPTIPSPMQQIIEIQDKKPLQPKRRNTKLPVKVFSEPEIEIVKEKIEPKAPSKTGLEFYRQYLPNLRKLIEIRPKVFVNRMFSGFNSKKTENNLQRNYQQKSANGRKQQVIRRRQKPTPNIVGIVDADQASESNRLPVKRVQLYLV